MLIDFEVSNYRSILNPACLSLVAARPIKEHQDTNVIPGGRFDLLKTAAIYGANASGKSNLVDALVHMRWMVLNSVSKEQEELQGWHHPFKLNPDSIGKPSQFEVRFALHDEVFRYGFQNDASRIRAEWLFVTRKKGEIALFVREDDDLQIHRREFTEGKGLEQRTRADALFLSVAAQFNGPLAGRVLGWFRNIQPLHGLWDLDYSEYSMKMLQDPDRRDRIVDFIRSCDTGIQDLRIRARSGAGREGGGPTPGVLLAKEKSERYRSDFTLLDSVHGVYDGDRMVGSVALNFKTEESAGTRKLFWIAGVILDCLEKGGVAVIDELDARLHPLLSSAILSRFHSVEHNPMNAQLVFATHDTNLLQSGRLRRDQIWFIEKNPQGASELYSLAEFKLPKGQKVRNDASFQKNYLQGRYGAVPFLESWGGLDGLREESGGRL